MRYFLFCFSFLTLSYVSGQSVIAVQGDSYTSANVRLDFTLGEVIIATVSDTNQVLTQGFHQTQWELTGIHDNDPVYEANVFPNPTSEYLTLEAASFQGVDFTMYDAIGKTVIQGKLDAPKTDLAVHFLSEGSYILVLYNEAQLLKSFKLIKRN